ncbi:hypothetical protein [Treponema endosymbiont of Eucomonympha sp.]|jgi:hypothetical protein|uniref:hypothetical protein n=1 Tax=Treponema endosymbiont of Eucomonympha sp. TaxID=1580831 RepID=UPI0007516F6D|nr:hypothetical protein [Treponema endosymbiont of Eucomonympha sp.]
MKFDEYLRTQHRTPSGRNFSPKSVHNCYVAITGTITTWANKNDIWQGSVADITDIDTFRQVKEAIERLPVFKSQTMTGNGMYAYALKYYLEYLCFIHA